MRIAQVNANDNLINSYAKEAMDGDTGIKDISTANNMKPEKACVYNQGDTMDTDGFGLLLSEEDIKGTATDANKDVSGEENDSEIKEEVREEELKREGAKLEEKVALLDEETIKWVLESEVSLDEYTKETLDRTIARITTQRAKGEESIEAQVDNIKAHKEELKKAIVSRLEERIEAELRKYGSGASKNIISQIQSALMMAKVVGNADIATTNSLIRQNLAPTISNVYMSGYNHRDSNYVYSVPSGLETQIETIIEENGFADKEYLMQAAGAMLEERLPITKETLGLHMDMKVAKDNYSEDVMLSKVALNVATGGNPMDTLVTEDEQVQKLDFIEKMCQDMEHLSGVKSFLATRTLNEVRLAMTTDASIKMSVKNIDVNVEDITLTLDALKAIEERLYLKLFKGEDISIQDAKVASSTMCKVERSISIVSYNKEVLVGETFSQRQTTTLGGFENAVARYEESATEVRRDLGDNIAKAFDNIPSLLEELSMAATERNVRAVRELGYASMEITVENVEQMKAYDMNFDTLVNNLTPSVTKKLIENGINPLDMTVDELNEKTLQLRSELPKEDAENYAQFLYRMDKSGDMTKEMRDAYVGIYRLIKNIQNSDGVAVSTAYKAGMEMTLSNLLTCLRTSKSKGVDSVVSDEFGSASIEVEGTNISIDAQINKIAYFNKVIDNLSEGVSPQLITEYEKTSHKMFVEENIEVLEDMMESATVKESAGYKEGEKEFLNTILENAKEGLVDAKENAVLLHQLGLEINVGNLVQMHETGNTLGKRVKNLRENDDTNDASNILDNDDLDHIFSDEDVLEDKLNQLYDELVAEIEKFAGETYEPDKVMQAGMLVKGIAFSRKMMDKGCFEIPLSTDAGIANIRLQFARNEEKVGQVNIFMEDVTMGEVNVSIKLKGETQVKGFIACETRAGYEFFAKENVSLQAQFSNQGIDVVAMDYALGRKTRSYYSESAFSDGGGKMTNSSKVLLEAAKITVRHIMKGIGEINENQS